MQLGDGRAGHQERDGQEPEDHEQRHGLDENQDGAQRSRRDPAAPAATRTRLRAKMPARTGATASTPRSGVEAQALSGAVRVPSRAVPSTRTSRTRERSGPLCHHTQRLALIV